MKKTNPVFIAFWVYFAAILLASFSSSTSDTKVPNAHASVAVAQIRR